MTVLKMKPLIAFLASTFICGAALAHGGGTDENGCHIGAKGKEHCHVKKKDAKDLEIEDAKERHRKFCRGTPNIPNSAPRWDAYGKPCKAWKG